MATFAERNITNFRDRLVGGGARPNLFEVNIELPDGVVGQADYRDDVRFMVKAAEIPAANIGNIPVPFRGRVLPVAGDRTFDPWTVTVINDSKFNIRDAMEQWSNKINDLQFDVGDISPASYQTKAEVFQLSRGGKSSGASSTGGETINVLRTYCIGLVNNIASPFKAFCRHSSALSSTYCIFLPSGGGLITLANGIYIGCLLYTSPSPRDRQKSRMPSSA